MTTTHAVSVPPSSNEDITGECSYIIDARKRNNEVVCGDEAVAEVLVKNDFGLFVVLLCQEHKDLHREFYRNRNRVRSRPRRHS